MAHKNEEEYKTSPQKRAYDTQWRLDHPGYHSISGKKHVEDNKEDLVYIIEIEDEYYFGSTKQGLARRKNGHLGKLRNGKSNPRMQKIFNDLGEDKFLKIFKMTPLQTCDSIEHARKVEKYLLKKHVGKSKCMNISK